jgi:beta-glucosidase
MTNQLVFPRGFLWGTASSAHQVEGNNFYNQWWRFEQRPGAIWRGDRSGLACDWWRNAEQDFDRMQGLHLNAHRLSLEWSRIEPEPGRINHEALDRYRAMLGALHERGIKPVLALHHFTNPRWFERAGGWAWHESVVRFQNYVRIAVLALRDLCDFWLTMNEPIVHWVQGWVRGVWPPQKRNPFLAQRALTNLLAAHAAAYRTIHACQTDAQVGYAHACHDFQPQRPHKALDRLVTGLRTYLIDDLWVRATVDGRFRPPLGVGRYHHPLADSLDFIGINYYTSLQVRFCLKPLMLFGQDSLAGHGERSDSGRNGPYSAYTPSGIYRHCRQLSALGKPIYITENGLPDQDDDQRPRWLLGHLKQIHRALSAGCDIRGYFHWTFVDNFEWSEGWGLRFGLFALDPQKQVRTERPSAQLFGAIAQANAITRPLVEKYAPEIVGECFTA